MRALLATDLSAASEAAIETQTSLDCLACIGVEEIHLVTVVPANVHSGMPGIDFETRRKGTLEEYRRVIENAGFTVETHVVRGTPHRRIIGIARTVGADLTMIGSRGSSPLENRIIGSTARNLARKTVTPLLVNRIEHETDDPDVVRRFLFQRMLYATDFSVNAERAFEEFSYLRHAAQEATLVHVQTPKDAALVPADDPHERLEEIAGQLEEWGLETRIDVRTGDPATEILAAEAEFGPTMTVLGSRGHSRLRRLLLGSVSEEVVAKAHGNVLLVPPEQGR